MLIGPAVLAIFETGTWTQPSEVLHWFKEANFEPSLWPWPWPQGHSTQGVNVHWWDVVGVTVWYRFIQWYVQNRNLNLVELYKEKTSSWPCDLDLEVKVTQNYTDASRPKVNCLTKFGVNPYRIATCIEVRRLRLTDKPTNQYTWQNGILSSNNSDLNSHRTD